MSFRRSIGVVGLTQIITFSLGLANVVIVSRLLSPEEIGLFSVAVSVLGFAHIVREFGVGHYLVQAANVGPSQLRAAFTVAIISAWSVAGLIFLFRFPMAEFYGDDGIQEILFLIGINFLVLPLGTPVLALMKRDRKFGQLALITIVGTFVQTGVTVAAAFAGESYLSMAWGSLATALSTVVMLQFMRPADTLIMPAFTGIREVLRFGSITSLSSIVEQFGRSAPDLIFGRTLGFAEVAFYSRGVGVTRMIVERINALVRVVHFPTFAADLRKGQDAAELYIKVTDYLVVVTVPLLAVLAILSDSLILFMFGAQWERSVPISIVVCSASILVAPYSLLGLSLIAAGHVSIHLVAETIIQVFRVLILLSSIWFPLEAVVMLLVLAYLIEAIVAQSALRRAFGLAWLSLMRRLWRAMAVVPFASTGPAIVVWVGWHWGLSDQYRPVMLIVASLLATIGWICGLAVLMHPMRTEILKPWVSAVAALRAHRNSNKGL